MGIFDGFGQGNTEQVKPNTAGSLFSGFKSSPKNKSNNRVTQAIADFENSQPKDFFKTLKTKVRGAKPVFDTFDLQDNLVKKEERTFGEKYNEFMNKVSTGITAKTARFGLGAARTAGSTLGAFQTLSEQPLQKMALKTNPIYRLVDKIFDLKSAPNVGDKITEFTEKADRAISELTGQEKSFFDHVIEGAGSSVGFLAGGIAGKAAGVETALLNLGLSGTEALINSYDDYKELVKTDSKNKKAKALGSFALNLGVNYVTNKLGFLAEPIKDSKGGVKNILKTFFASTGLETGQETSQQIVSDVVKGTPFDQALKNAGSTALVTLPIAGLFGVGGAYNSEQQIKEKEQTEEFLHSVADQGTTQQEVTQVMAALSGQTEEAVSQMVQEYVDASPELNDKFAKNFQTQTKKEVGEIASQFTSKEDTFDFTPKFNEKEEDTQDVSAKKPFSEEEQNSWNNNTHFPINYNREYNLITNKISSKIKERFGNSIPEEIKQVFQEYEIKAESFLREKGKQMTNAPSPFVTGRAGYNFGKADKARSLYERKVSEFNQYTESIEKQISSFYKKQAQEKFNSLSEVEKIQEEIEKKTQLRDRLNPTRDDFIIEQINRKINSLTKKLNKLKGSSVEEETKFNEKKGDRKTLPERPVETQRVTQYKERLKLRGADPVVVDAIITPSGNRAYGVSVGGTLTFENVVEQFTEDHEVFHQVFQNMERMRLFKDFDKAALMGEAKALYGDLSEKQLEEELARDFQQYVSEREAGKPTSFFGKILDFFQKLMASLKRVFRSEMDINEFYRTVYEGRATETTDVANTTTPSFNEQLQSGLLDFRPTSETASNFLEEVPAEEAFTDTGELTLKTITKLQGRTVVSKQYISDLTNSGDIKQVERDLLREVLSTYPDGAKIPVVEFVEKVKTELLPLTVESEAVGGDAGIMYEFVTLPDNLRGNVADYYEKVYGSPVKTSAAKVHFQGMVDNYFGHTRVEDMADGDTRRVIEVQSDLYQKGGVEKINNDPAHIFHTEEERAAIFNGEGTIEERNAKSKALQDRKTQERARLLQYNDPTAHFRMIREEIKKAAQDGKTKLQFPTGETAMKIEGLGVNSDNWLSVQYPNQSYRLSLDNLKVGNKIARVGEQEQWIITDVLGDGKFKAVQKETLEKYGNPTISMKERIKEGLFPDSMKESFDISGKVDTTNPIYKFYEKEVGRYLKNNYDAKTVTDDKGVTWYEIDVLPVMATYPVPAFNEKRKRESKWALRQAELKARGALIPENGPKNVIQTEDVARDALNFDDFNATLRAGDGAVRPFYEEEKEITVTNPNYQSIIEKIKLQGYASLEDFYFTVRKTQPARMASVGSILDKVNYPESIQEKEAALEIKRDVVESSPLKPLLKFVQRKGEFAGQLPEVTGKADTKSKFKKSGDVIIDEAMGYKETAQGANDVEEVREKMDDYQKQRKELAQEERQLAEEKKLYLIEAKDEIALDAIGIKQAEKIEKDIDRIEQFKLAEAKARKRSLEKRRAEIEKKERKYGFKVPEFNENEFPEIGQIIAAEDELKAHPARPFLKYINKRTGILPQIQDDKGVYGEIMTKLLKKKGYSSVLDAQRVIDNYLALSEYLNRLTEERFNPIEMAESPSVNTSATYETEKDRIESGDQNAESVEEMEKTGYPLKKKVGVWDYLRTPERVLIKLGLWAESKLVKKQYRGYLKELPKNIDKITEWSKRVPDAGAAKRIFDYLDGFVDPENALAPQVLTGEEAKVADEIKVWLEEWAGRLHIPRHERIGNYITHIFEDDLYTKEFDEDLAKIIQDRIAGEVYNPFLEKRLGQLGYIHDVFRALDAYTKRATRKVYMDPALEQLKIAAAKLDRSAVSYIKNYVDRINLRPTAIDESVDISIKQFLKFAFGNEYIFGARPVARLSQTFRKVIYRGTLGLNVGSALKNLSQGANTFAALGPKYTYLGYQKLLSGLNQLELEEEGILGMDIIQDRTMSATKKFWEKFDKTLFIFFETAEKINRGAAYFGAKAKYYDENTRMEAVTVNGKQEKIRVYNEGASEQGARDYARSMVERTQFTFGSVDTPPILQSDLAKTLLQFQSFGLKQAEFLATMARNKEYAGFLRYILASLVMILTIGKLFNMTWKDMIPFSRYGLPPVLKVPLEIIKSITGVKDQFGNVPSKATRFKNAVRAVTVLVPGGVQASKIYKGLDASKFGGTTIQNIRSVIFGPIAESNENKVNKSISKSVITAKTKLDGMNDETVQAARTAWKEAKSLDQKGRNEIVKDLSDSEYAAYKLVKASDSGYQEKLAKKVTDIVETNYTIGFDTKEAAANVKELTDEEYDAYKKVKSSIYGEKSTDIKEWDELSLTKKITNLAKGLGTDPVKMFGNVFNGDWRVVGIKNGTVIVARMSKEESQAIKKKYGLTGDNYILDHIVPLTAGGENTKYNENNLQLIPESQWKQNTPVEVFLGDALKDKKISASQAREYIIRFKAGKGQKLSPKIQKEWTEEYNSQPLSFEEIKSLVQ